MATAAVLCSSFSPMSGTFWQEGTSNSASDYVTLSSDDEVCKMKMSGMTASCFEQPSKLSTLERVLSRNEPVLESLIAQLPTSSIFALFHTSSFLRSYLRDYPLAWRALSFRLPQPTVMLGSPGMEAPESRERQSKHYALDALLIRVVIPLATRLKSLDLCNTAISGIALTTKVLQPRIGTLEHLSVRGCKNVSIKYHIVPFLQLHNPSQHPWAERLALKSLYTYRCRHHRRRPYLPSSLIRRDSDSEPTHELIELCHQLGIWTDTAWCPTPGGRCFRRKDYHGNRAAPGTQEVWVPFDRLWRSGNRIGPTDEKRTPKGDGRLWEDNESGHDGEALGTETFTGDGKYLPAHERKSHTTFVDDIKCDQCSDTILERCETCSIKMHCMGCRKTLCGSCAFNRPIPRKRSKVRYFPSLLGTAHINFAHTISQQHTVMPPMSQSRHLITTRQRNKFWWAPGVTRSPNLMSELPPDSDSDEDDSNAAGNMAHLPSAPSAPLKLSMHWCCLEPIFSGGGGVAFLGPGLGGTGSDRIRAVPLPKKKEYEDHDFQHTLVNSESIEKLRNVRLYEEIMGENVDVLPYLMQESIDLQATTCPRSLCQDCFRSFRWRVACRGCKRPLCKEHDFRGLKVRKCGFRDLSTEREYIRNPPKEDLAKEYGKGRWDIMAIPAFRQRMEPQSSGASTPVPNTYAQEEGEGSVPMARITSTASSSADSSQLLSAPTSTPTDPTDMVSSSSPSRDIPGRATLGTLSSSSRHRSISLSGLSDRATAMVAIAAAKAEAQKRVLLPGQSGLHPVQWQGCGSYFCQATRPVGDCRTRCSSTMKECGDCGVLVCEYCLQDLPTCPCTYCQSNYHCPVCAAKPASRMLCTRDEEMRVMEAERKKEKDRVVEEESQRAWANEVAEAVGEFFLGMNEESAAFG